MSTIAMSTRTDELARLLPTALRSVVRLLAVDLDKSDIGLRLSQFGVLDFLLTNSRAVQTDLANHFAKDKSVVLRQLDEMEQAGWVERQMDPNDRRRKILVVTKAGAELHKKATRLRDKVFARVLEGVDERDMGACLRVLHIMNDNANHGDAQ
jgi:DNA-binding MarR family transcriptional regulator